MSQASNLSDDELTFVTSKNTNKNKLIFAVLLKYFQLEGHYPKHIKYIDPLLIQCLANQLNISASYIDDFDWEGRSTKRFRHEIRNLLGYKKATLNDIDKLKSWLIKEVFPNAPKKQQHIEYAYNYFRQERMEPFASKALERHIQSAHKLFKQRLFDDISLSLSHQTKKQMDSLLINNPYGEQEEERETIYKITFNSLKKDIPGAQLKQVAAAINKMIFLKDMQLPEDRLSNLSIKLITKYYLRVMADMPSNLLEYKESTRYALFTLFCYWRSRLLTDNLAELLIQLIHKIRTSAENFINKKILSEVKRVKGKFDILYLLSFLALQHPTGIIQEKIYPEVGQETLNDLVKEHHSKGKWYNNQVQKKMHSLYSHAHRKMLLHLLDALSFKTNLNDSKPLLEAIQIIKMYQDSSDRYYPSMLAVPIKGVISTDWERLVIVNENGKPKINRLNYEIAVFEELRKQLRCKIIWIEGAHRYRNPDEDLPKDFEEKRSYYYGLLGLPMNAKEFTAPRKKELHENLKALNESIPTNKKVKLINKNSGHIKISPYDPQAEPANIQKLHQAIKEEYGTINLIDVLKEADMQIGFTEHCNTVASRENLTKEKLQYRLLLGIYGIGTNTGLKCISAANGDAKYSDLRYVKRRFITIENVRQMIVSVINKTLEIRDPRIWGVASTGVACDSKQMSVWDQNLMVEWHGRYKKRGVMVYWHVEKKALCIYSQLKTCSSSEVGAMLKGILDHCTDMEINEAYMDTHGQSLLAFGVSEFLTFYLLPRLKDIYKQKLYYPSSSQKGEYKNLELILKEPINWKLIEEYYDEAVKHIIALKIGTMDPDVFVKRFSKDNYQHPVFQAIIEIGKVAKTNFMCRYLMSEELRIEVHEAQNVVERLNSIMGFIFFGKLGEISTNVKSDQELSILCLHLLQACMAYINTLIFQNVLSKPEWKNILTAEDNRALNVLFHSHLNPYGLFPLDLETRLGITLPPDNVELSEESYLMEEQKEEEIAW